MNWIQRNIKTIIYIAFLVPIITVAIVSISHVTTWYGLSNPVSWALYLSFGIEIAALSSLAAISVEMGNKVYLPFGVVTLIQFIGNIFFAYQYIDINSEVFLDWVNLVDPIVVFLGIEADNLVAHKRFLALFSGGMLPIISLSFLHMLVKFEEEEKKKRKTQEGYFDAHQIQQTGNTDNIITNFDNVKENLDVNKLSRDIGEKEYDIDKEKFTPSEDELNKIQEKIEEIINKKFGLPDNELKENNSNDLDSDVKDIEEDKEVVSESNSELTENDEPKIKRLNYLKRDV